METDQETVDRFTGLLQCSEEVARFCLDASGGNFDAAISMYYDQVTSRPQQGAAHGPAPGGTMGPPVPLLLRLVGAALQLPFAALSTVLHAAFVIARTGSRGAAAVLPPRLVHAVSTRASALSTRLSGPGEATPAAAAARLARELQTAFGSAIDWQACGWQEAAGLAAAEGRFLFVYLHAPRHQDTPRFLSDTLGDPSVTTYISQHFSAWAGSVQAREGHALAHSLGAARFPCTALLAGSGARTQLLACTEGFCCADELMTTLQAARDRSEHMLWRERALRQERDLSRRLREEQDAEFNSSLEADRKRQADAEAAAARQAAEEQRKGEEALAARRAESEAAAARAAAEEELRSRREAKRAALPTEPESSAPHVATLRIRLPDGGMHQRRFRESDDLQVVYDFVDSLDSEAVPLRYTLATTFPRREFGSSDRSQTLHELGLTPQAALLLQPLL
ncbi:hypothetical protein ACKKBG_A38165 [Auxenochlorella protothecoides x Auxenochlorella symbiontica]